MQIKQWEDKNLAHFSYAIVSDCEKKIVLVDPARNAEPYLEYAKEQEATIIGIIETHPHADFTSSHLELHQITGATIYTSSLSGVAYPHAAFDEGSEIKFGKIRLYPLHTPGHSPDSISIVMEHDGKQKAVFTGDTLFIGDCGRPDLREGAGNIKASRTDLAKQMYHSLRNKLMQLEDDVIVYPAHGAGTLCGKNLSKENSSTIGEQKQTNWSLQDMSEEEFVKNLLSDQPFIPLYFPYDVELNRKGAAPFRESIEKVERENLVNKNESAQLDYSVWTIDGRDEKDYKEGHFPHSINLMEDGKFETWLGSIIHPGEEFYLVADKEERLQRMIERAAAIGYEGQIKEALLLKNGLIEDEKLDMDAFKENTEEFTIVDVRNASEVRENKPFPNSIHIPLAELRDKAGSLPDDKPIVVHCAAGYRSAAGSSLIKSSLDGRVKVIDMGEKIKDFLN